MITTCKWKVRFLQGRLFGETNYSYVRLHGQHGWRSELRGIFGNSLSHNVSLGLFLSFFLFFSLSLFFTLISPWYMHMASGFVFIRDTWMHEQGSLYICFLFLFLASFSFCLSCSILMLFVLSLYYIIYYNPLGACLLSNEKQKGDGSGLGGSREELGVEAGKTLIRIDTIWKKIYFQSKKNKKVSELMLGLSASALVTFWADWCSAVEECLQQWEAIEHCPLQL